MRMRKIAIAAILAVVGLVPTLASAASVVVSASNMRLESQQDVTVKFVTSEDVDVFGIEVHLSYDPSVLRVVDVRTAGDLDSWGAPIYHVNTDGTVGIAIASAYSLVSPEDLFVVRFESLKLGESTIEIPRAVINETVIGDRVGTTVNVQTVAAEETSSGAFKSWYVK